jgi:hypothetical protein
VASAVASIVEIRVARMVFAFCPVPLMGLAPIVGFLLLSFPKINAERFLPGMLASRLSS